MMKILRKAPLEIMQCLEERDQFGKTALLQAAEFKGAQSLAIMQKMIMYGANVNAQDYTGRTALYMAVLQGELGKAKILLEAGAIPHLTDIDCISPLHCSISAKRADIATLLLQHGHHVNISDNEGDTPLHWAVRERLFHFSHLLRKFHADDYIRNCDGEVAADLC